MTDDEIELIHSPLTRTHSADGHTLHIQIYRSAGSPWILGIEDELGTSTVWDEPFDTDTAALEAAFLAMEEEGIHAFVTNAQREAKAAEPELMRKLAQTQRTAHKVGRNEPCPCGSDKKFKKCCGAPSELH